MLRNLFSLVATLLIVAPTVVAAGTTLKNELVLPYISLTTGVVVAKGISLQTTITASKDCDGKYCYVGVFSNYSASRGELTELDLFMGVTHTFAENWNTNLSVAFVTDGTEFVSLAGDVSMSRTFRYGTLTVTPKLSWMPQIASNFPNGHYVKAGATFVLQPEATPELSLKLQPWVVYDTGAYGASPGVSKHLKLGAHWQLNKKSSFELGVEAHRTHDGVTNTAARVGLVFSF